MKHWNPTAQRNHFSPVGEWEKVNTTTLASMRQPGKYWIVSDSQLKRDLAGRTIKDVYRENRRLRGVERGYTPRWEIDSQCGGGLFNPTNNSPTIADEYRAHCLARNHTPHPASVDSDHAQNVHRLKAPRRDIDFVLSLPAAPVMVDCETAYGATVRLSRPVAVF